MKSFRSPTLLFFVLNVLSVSSPADSVYVTRGDKGPVYSDKALPGAREVTLKPLNVITPPPISSKSAPLVKAKNKSVKPEKVVVEYRKFSVLSPEDNGSVLANTAIFEVRLAVEPRLQLGEGHAFDVSINGRSVGQRFTATEFMIPPEFWGGQMPLANQELQLDASIVDENGKGVMKAPPVRFFMRYPMVRNLPIQRFKPPGVTSIKSQSESKTGLGAASGGASQLERRGSSKAPGESR